jgi:hypothetical protein
LITPILKLFPVLLWDTLPSPLTFRPRPSPLPGGARGEGERCGEGRAEKAPCWPKGQQGRREGKSLLLTLLFKEREEFRYFESKLLYKTAHLRAFFFILSV